MNRHYLTFLSFFATHREGLAQVLAGAYQQASGHYAAMSLAEQQRQAEIDSLELIADLLRGEIDLAHSRHIVAVCRAHEVAVEDIRRMTIVFGPLFNAWVRAQLPDNPGLAQALIRRYRTVSTHFRANLTVAEQQLAPTAVEPRQAHTPRPAALSA